MGEKARKISNVNAAENIVDQIVLKMLQVPKMPKVKMRQ